MKPDFVWEDAFARDVQFGYLGRDVEAPKRRHPQIVLNGDATSVLRTVREELARCDGFDFSVAFVSPRAIALLKQEFIDFKGEGRIVTSDYLGFNRPEAFAELLNLGRHGIDVRIHTSEAFHPKGYVFRRGDDVTAMIGSSNLTETALVRNHEWNLKVSAASDSDLADQLMALVDSQLAQSAPLTDEWLAEYTAAYVPPAPRAARTVITPTPETDPLHRVVQRTRIQPNRMQAEALLALSEVRRQGKTRAIVISATGTGKTMLSALDVRAVNPSRMLFVVHREQILDRTIEEYRKVLEHPESDFGKLTGNIKQPDRRFVFATVQTLSQQRALRQFEPDAFDYVIIDEAHRAGAASYRGVIDYLAPQFLLGMTATPERTDAFNVFELFNYVVPYEIRLNRALAEDMLSPFHYYGVSDVTFEDGSTTDDMTEVRLLASATRADHVVAAMETYGQAGVQPRGLIFCGRKDEAVSLSVQLNARTLRGQLLRTVALTGDDPITHREAMVEKLEQGGLDYILTVDVFNEGVDIPTVNQVLMLRQTQSAIVFVQQLGRGLRKARDKEYLVVIDFIGNYANNYLIPIALFGDESLDKESLRKNLISAEEIGVLPGLSSVRFDKISQERVLQSISDTSLDAMPKLKAAIESMRNRVGGIPRLWDFHRFESVDPVVLATKKDNYASLVEGVLKLDLNLSPSERRALSLLSHEVLPAKRAHDAFLFDVLLREGPVTEGRVAELFAAAGIEASASQIQSAIDTLTLERHAETDRNRYRDGVAFRHTDGRVALSEALVSSYRQSPAFEAEVDDIVRTGRELAASYDASRPFTPGRQYSRKEVTRLLCWPRSWTSTLYGYKVDLNTAQCPIFVTLHKSGEVSASTAYEDKLLDRRTMLWYTRSRRTLESDEVRAIVENRVAIDVFVKKDDAEGSDFYYLGRAVSQEAEQTTMQDDHARQLDVVRMHLLFDAPIEAALYDYFHPVVTELP